MLREVEESDAVKGVVAGLCAYETLAILTGRAPTITAVHRRYPVVGAAIVVALAWHFRLFKEQ